MMGLSVVRATAKDLAYARIKEDILTGRLGPGSSVTEDELAKTLGLSRTPLREAIRALEMEELLVRLPNGRLAVPGIDSTHLRHLFSVRKALERLVVESVCREASDEDIHQALYPIVSGIESALEAGLGGETSRYGEQFHYALVDLSRNRIAARLLVQLRDHIRRYRSIGPAHSPERRAQAAREHISIFRLIKSRQAEEAGRAMEEHIDNGMQVAVRYLDEVEGGGSPSQAPIEAGD